MISDIIIILAIPLLFSGIADLSAGIFACKELRRKPDKSSIQKSEKTITILSFVAAVIFFLPIIWTVYTFLILP